MVINSFGLGTFGAVLAFFHLSEFTLAAIFQRAELGWHSLLITKAYSLAMGCAAMEHLAEAHRLPGVTSTTFYKVVSWVGMVAVVAGEALRLAAVLTARGNFTHMLRFKKAPTHVLVTSGVYSWIRHPGYAGFFIWALGTQLMLVNPCCLVMFAVLVWAFFDRRIAVEEQQLSVFFGTSYLDYKARVPSGIPLIP
mmetsp:Transcript_17494/g.52515  ORF Transcript_17494/g.52515 Transcript_17494/m.52515 type:complete len:195 (+) Transcript_17494:290-874(+)